MVRFLDGLAAGVVLLLHRAPPYLRVVRSVDGTWDALDQLDDMPAPDETIHVYRREGPASTVHVDYRRGRRGPSSAWYALASYRVVATQPGDEVVRSTPAWRGWCQTQAKMEVSK